jgi:hypothetical protein
MPLGLQMKNSVILPIKHTWFPAKKGNHFIRSLGGKKEAMIVRNPEIPLDPPNGSPNRLIGHFLERRHFSEQ